ncbi:MAG TPA: hypothetical protein VM694_31500 [Polyangium sp.]|nr:hypothetical protein [Polyangium sp.]
MRPSLLLALALVACGGAPPRERPAVAEPLRAPLPCTRIAELVRIERVPETENELTLTPNPGFGQKTTHFEGSLNDDRYPDLIVYFNDTCGSTHECMRGVYLGCGEGEYLPVWGPEYTFAMQPSEFPTSNGYRLIKQTDRTSEYEASVVDLHFDGRSYQPVPPPKTAPRP